MATCLSHIFAAVGLGASLLSAGTVSAETTALNATFDNAEVRTYGNGESIQVESSTGEQLNVRLAAPDAQSIAVVEDAQGNRAMQFTSNSPDTPGLRVFTRLAGASTEATGNNQVAIAFDLTPLPLEGDRPTLQIVLNANGSQTPNGRDSALHFRIGASSATDQVKVSYFDGKVQYGGGMMDPGTTYRFTIVANFASHFHDVYDIHVAPVEALDKPIMELSTIETRAPNVLPDILVFDGAIGRDKVNPAPFVQVDNLKVQVGPRVPPPAADIPANTLWQIGFDDISGGEFSSPALASYTIPADWKTRTDWNAFSRQILRSDQPTLDLSFNLDAVPPHGVEFSFRSMRTAYTTPELAIYANGQFAGLIQTRGTRLKKTSTTGDFRQVYRLYIPSEMLQPGANVLRLETPRMLYTTSDAGDWAGLIGWDYLRLTALDQPADEPIHGRVVYAGTCFMHNHSQHVTHDQVRCAQPVLEWMGITYSGNTMRANFWKNRANIQPARRELLEKYRELNMSVVADFMSGFHVRSIDPDGTLTEKDEAALEQFVAEYGDLFQYYEVGNEPALTGERFDHNLAVARHISAIKPDHVKVISNGWAFFKSGGIPDGWEVDPQARKAIEAYCDALGGHTYGTQFGGFQHHLDAYGPTVNDGFPKPLIVTEHGSIQFHHVDEKELVSEHPHTAAFDRNMRNLIAVAERFMQHAPYFKEGNGDMNLFIPVEDWTTFDPLDTQVYDGAELPDGSREEPRFKAYRRLALAYATHGQPLKYELLNRDALRYKRVYVRPVNTATLPPLPGSGATSDKVLLNFVNFEPTPQQVTVRIHLPQPGNWTGLRLTDGMVLREARSEVALDAQPFIEITESLEARGSVQYILQPPAAD